MTLTLIIWLVLFAGLTGATIVRPVFGVALYMLTFFLSPPFWWWGDPIEAIRWNLISGFVLLGAAALCPSPEGCGKVQNLWLIALAMILNATFVNFAIGGNSEESSEAYVMAVKFFALMYMIYRTVRSVSDLQIVMLSILLGAAYIGYEATINGRGDIVKNRLEGVGAPGATTANHFASLMVTIMPMVAPFFLAGKTWMKVLVVCLAPMIVNVVLLCNSRGAFLAAIGSAIVFIVVAPKVVRAKALRVVAVAALGVFMMLGDGRIVERFLSTFAGSEVRDRSAQSRFDFSQAGLQMIADFPLGAGGNGFKKVHGLKYLRETGASDIPRAVHNGYINEACEWGLQGLLLRMLWFLLAAKLAFDYTRRARDNPNIDQFLLLTQCALLSGLAAYLVTYMFGDQNSSEWGYWIVALIITTWTVGLRLEHEAEDWVDSEMDEELGDETRQWVAS